MPDVNTLGVKKERPNIMFIHICSPTEVGYDQPAGYDQLCMRPERDPAKQNIDEARDFYVFTQQFTQALRTS